MALEKIVYNFPELDNLSAIITFTNIDNDFLDNLAYDDMVNVATDKQHHKSSYEV